MKTLLGRIATAVWWTVAVTVIGAALLLGVARLTLPYVGEYKQEMEAWLSDYFNYPVSVERLDLRWTGFGPQLTLHQLRIARPDRGRSLFSVAEAYVDTDLWDLFLHGSGGIRNVTLEDLPVTVERRVDGSITIQGIEVWRPGGSRSGELPVDLLKIFGGVRRISLVGLNVVLDDRLHGFRTRLSGVELRIQNQADRHQLRLLVPMPAGLGDKLLVTLDFVGEADAPQTWSGTLYTAIDDLRAGAWAGLFGESPLRVVGGELGAALWADWHDGGVHKVSVQLDAADLDLSNKAGDHWGLRSLSVAGSWSADAHGWRAQLDRFAMTSPGELPWPSTRGVLEHRVVDGDTLLRGQIERLHLQTLAHAWRFLGAAGVVDKPPPAVVETTPRGVVRDLRFSLPLDGSTDGRAAQLEFADFGMDAWQQIPGAHNLSGRLTWSGDGGRVDLDARDVVVELPRLMRAPLSVTRLHGAIGVDVSAGLTLWSNRLLADNDDINTETRLLLSAGPDDALFVDWQSSFHDGDGSAASTYVPAGVMPGNLVAWLDKAVVGGRVIEGSATLYGDPRGFPFRDGDGVFQVDFDVEQTGLHYQDGWPEVEAAAANVRFVQAGLYVNGTTAVISDGQVTRFEASIPDLEVGELELHGEALAQVPQAMDYVRNSPLSERFGAFLEGADGSGPVAVALDLFLPVRDVDSTRVAGTLSFDDAELNSADWNLRMSAVQGEVAFTDEGVTIEALRGRMRGRDVRVSADGYQGGTRFAFTGEFSVRELLDREMQDLSRRFTGRSNWQVLVDLPPPRPGGIGEVAIHATSDLHGIDVDLPAPLAKPADQIEPFALTLRLGASAVRRVGFRYAQRLTAELLLRRRGEDFEVTRADVRSGAATARLPRRDIFRIEVEAPEIDIDGWLAWLGDLPGGERGAARMSKLHLRTPRAIYLGEPIGELAVTSLRTGDVFSVGLSNPLVRGSLGVPFDADGSDPVRVDLQFLDLALFLRDTDTADDGSRLQPGQIPPMEISIATLLWTDAQFDDVRIVSSPGEGRAVIEEISFRNPGLGMQGEGEWRVTRRGAHLSRISFRLESDDWGSGLGTIGYAQTMAGGQGNIAGELSWPDAAYRPRIEILRGDLRVNLRDGVLVGADPGLGRIVGLFSLQAIPRRLTGDFKEFMVEGFKFDRIKGTVELVDGVAYTNNMLMRGSVGRVYVKGTSDMRTQTYDQEVSVIPDLSASVPLVGELVLPGSGLAMLAMGVLLKQMGVDVESAGELKYTLRGPWDDPVMEAKNVPAPDKDPVERNK